jgi:hypothetical protein
LEEVPYCGLKLARDGAAQAPISQLHHFTVTSVLFYDLCVDVSLCKVIDSGSDPEIVFVIQDVVQQCGFACS